MASLTGTLMLLLVVVYFTALFASFGLNVLHSLPLGNKTFFSSDFNTTVFKVFGDLAARNFKRLNLSSCDSCVD